ncbi:acetyl-CoA carboxylase biotin carboxyl carrier protein [Eubacterium pyruvativorans]|uniref:acetyl-CoA carboxylase biotin carboxyl carrier protein n=1 Tax=Eubacterium pyruvativorans TaxID=155865 RepID=UPI0015644810|nr:acetyl-CoA carboxylase biotin carboxyl carrier protein [Eubacterium pyruvativorans]MDD6708031.1 acetyl-CoA carboxylase biotin carboxyl carrier protein [Eubacterium pyruvativorans]MDY4049216.1 acetyl-CoA carboxylase biotin carboxyl carrier protein [Eubacterium pyruvativorans]
MEDTKLYELIDRFEGSSLTLLHLEEGDLKIRLERALTPGALPASAGSAVSSACGSPSAGSAVSTASAAPTACSPSTACSPASAAPAQVKAPLVGVFYAAPKPEEPPFVQVGQEVRKGQVLCLVEAMKMMNELTSPVDGIVRAIHGRNGELVEFDQVLFEIEAK